MHAHTHTRTHGERRERARAPARDSEREGCRKSSTTKTRECILTCGGPASRAARKLGQWRLQSGCALPQNPLIPPACTPLDASRVIVCLLVGRDCAGAGCAKQVHRARMLTCRSTSARGSMSLQKNLSVGFSERVRNRRKTKTPLG
jgi:hypothetical protein